MFGENPQNFPEPPKSPYPEKAFLFFHELSLYLKWSAFLPRPCHSEEANHTVCQFAPNFRPTKNLRLQPARHIFEEYE